MTSLPPRSTDTPLTDAAFASYFDYDYMTLGTPPPNGWDLARSLERQLSTLRALTIEECAKVCDERATDWREKQGYAKRVSRQGEAVDCAAAIRALAPQPEPDETAGPITGLTREEFDAKVFRALDHTKIS